MFGKKKDCEAEVRALVKEEDRKERSRKALVDAATKGVYIWTSLWSRHRVREPVTMYHNYVSDAKVLGYVPPEVIAGILSRLDNLDDAVTELDKTTKKKKVAPSGLLEPGTTVEYVA